MPADSAVVAGCVSATVAAIREALSLSLQSGYEAGRKRASSDELAGELVGG